MPVRREGCSSQTWKVIDFGGLLVHVMHPDVRAKYNLEKIWNAYGSRTKEAKVKKTAIKKFATKKKTLKSKISKKKIYRSKAKI